MMIDYQPVRWRMVPRTTQGELKRQLRRTHAASRRRVASHDAGRHEQSVNYAFRDGTRIPIRAVPRERVHTCLKCMEREKI